MKLSKQQFEQLLREHRLVLSLIGMSNVGKTYWSKKLSAIGFKHINCDDIIEAKLAPVLKELGYSGIEEVSRWMGQPHEERSPVNQQKYLLFEKETMKNILAKIKNGANQNIVIDTTGSIVHTGENYCNELKEHTLVVYIKANENRKKEMFHQYIKEPKPVIFGDLFAPHKNETVTQTLKRCYRELLDLRSTLYAKYTDVTIAREAVKEGMGVAQFLSLIKQAL